MQSKYSIRIPLFWKFAIISTIVVVIFGSVNIYLLWSSVYQSFEQEIDKRCKVLAKIVAEKSLDPIVYDNSLALDNILNEVRQSDPSISYIFILNNTNELIAQTYDIRIPDKLITVNSLQSNGFNIEVIKTNNYKYPVIRDIAYPILNGEIGVVRLGIVEEHIQAELYEATKTLILMIVVFLIVGLLGAFFFSYIITKPIKRISRKAQVINLNYIDVEEHNMSRDRVFPLFNIKVNDELDVLLAKFSEMLNRLRASYIDIRETQDALVQAEKMASLGTLSAGVAHEINNPISGIKNCVNRIIKNPENIEQNANYMILIKEAINKIENVVQHLLNFSRKQDLSFEKICINSVIKSAVVLTEYKLVSNNISLETWCKEKLYINGSSNHLDQVFVNLILNSIDAINERRKTNPGLLGEIDIDINRKANKLVIILKDNGIGIPEDIANKVFDPFFTSKEVGKGTGLGLSVTFNLIKEHKGNIYFNSLSQMGTEFVIELPEIKI